MTAPDGADRHPAPIRRWALWGLVIYGLAVVVVLLLPIGYASLVHAVGDGIRDVLGISFFGTGWIEFCANILMFAPLGFLLTLTFRHPWWGVALALGLSVAAEVGQIVIPAREPSLRDVFANGVGAAVGAFFAWLFVRRRDHKRARATAEPEQPVAD